MAMIPRKTVDVSGSDVKANMEALAKKKDPNIPTSNYTQFRKDMGAESASRSNSPTWGPSNKTMNGFGSDEKIAPGTSDAGLDTLSNDIIGRGTEEIEKGREAAQIATQERAGALGFGGSGMLAGAQQDIDSEANNQKANLARETRIAFAEKSHDEARQDAKEAAAKAEMNSEDTKANDLLKRQLAMAQAAAKNVQGGVGPNGAPDQFPVKFQVVGGGSGKKDTRDPKLGGGGKAQPGTKANPGTY